MALPAGLYFSLQDNVTKTNSSLKTQTLDPGKPVTPYNNDFTPVLFGNSNLSYLERCSAQSVLLSFTLIPFKRSQIPIQHCFFWDSLVSYPKHAKLCFFNPTSWSM